MYNNQEREKIKNRKKIPIYIVEKKLVHLKIKI